ncbi:unnamed protein product [Adineta ricciae]|uniref:alcohol dehydrogenase n=1 Tax=Adineta ricciae TaxID=249248 RepID=A0A813XH53_ADIRI|nr:unnamed protein product [Adineta ricciae]
MSGGRILLRIFSHGKSHISRSFSSVQTKSKLKTNPISGARTVFNGVDSKTMFAAQNIPLPELAPGEILAKVRLASICMSDVHTITGHRIEPTPSVLGHEAVVEVIDHRRPESNLAIGDRLTFSVADCCGNCEFCLKGLNQKCVKLFKYGHAKLSDGSGYNGCYATHIILRRGTHVVKIPDVISDRCAAPINCSLATTMAAMEHVPKIKNGRAFVQLHFVSMVLKKFIAPERVYNVQNLSIGSVPFHSTMLSGKRQNEVLHEETNKIDVVVEVCGVASVVNDGFRMLKPGGIYLFLGMVHPHSQLNITGEQIIRKCLTIQGIHNYAPRHLDQAVQFLAKTIRRYPYEEVMGPTYDLPDLPAAMKLATGKQYSRVLVKPNMVN